MEGKKPGRNVRWSPSKPSVKGTMSNHKNPRRKVENWDREADRLADQRERFIIAEDRKKEGQLQRARAKETKLWMREANKEGERRERFLQKLEEQHLKDLQKARDKETRQWTRESDREWERRNKFMDRQEVKKTKARERAELKKWNKEIRVHEDDSVGLCRLKL